MIEKTENGWQCTPEDFEKSVKWFTLNELTRSNYFDAACKAGVNPMPNPYQVESLRQLCIHLLDPLREAWKGPIIPTSGFRCEWINKQVGGVKNSQHLRGEAADIRPWNYNGVNNPILNRRLLGLLLFLDLSFDQCIAENCDENGYPEWLHLSYKSKAHNRHQFLVKKRPTPAPSPREGRGEKKQIQ